MPSDLDSVCMRCVREMTTTKATPKGVEALGANSAWKTDANVRAPKLQ